MRLGVLGSLSIRDNGAEVLCDSAPPSTARVTLRNHVRGLGQPVWNPGPGPTRGDCISPC
jgi:hypothetical protein